MLWMERFSLSFYLLSNVILLGFSFLIGTVSYNYMPTESDLFSDIKAAFILTLVFWFIVRLIDFLFAGPLRRKIKRESLNA